MLCSYCTVLSGVRKEKKSHIEREVIQCQMMMCSFHLQVETCSSRTRIQVLSVHSRLELIAAQITLDLSVVKGVE